MFDQRQARMRVTLCSSKVEAEALKAAGVRSVMVIDNPESVLIPGPDQQSTIALNLAPFNEFILAFGQHEAEKRDAVAIRLGDTCCRWIEWPESVSNAASMLELYGGDDLYQLATEAKAMWTDEVCLLDDIPDEGELETFRTGFRLLDDSSTNFGPRKFRLTRPAFMPVIGPYASGKSVLLRQLACNLWRLHGWRTLITSFEERVKPRYQRDLRRHLITRHPERGAGIEYSAKSEFTEEEIAAADAEINQAFRFLRRKRGALLDMDRLLDRIAYAIQVYGVEVVIIDPVNEVDHRVPRGLSKTDYMGDFMMGLKQLAEDYHVLMICAAHPPKEGTKDRRTRIYTLNDGADTAHYGNKADFGWCVWRPEKPGPTFLNVDKIKDTEFCGEEVMARLSFVNGGFRVDDVGESVLTDLLGGGDDDQR